jgi:hypothetical protein
MAVFEIHDMEDPKAFTYVKSLEYTSILVLLNFSSEEYDLEIPPCPPGKRHGAVGGECKPG